MAISRPGGEYKSQMTPPPQAWPDTDEDAHSSRAAELLGTALRVRTAAADWDRVHSSIFDGHAWLGRAADAGLRKTKGASEGMRAVEELISDSVRFHRNAYESITNAKERILATCDAAQTVIDQLTSLSLPNQDDQRERDKAIKAIVAEALRANTATVSAAAAAITTGQVYPAHIEGDIPAFQDEVPTFGSAAQRVTGGSTGGVPLPSRGGSDLAAGEKGAERLSARPPAAESLGARSPTTSDKGTETGAAPAAKSTPLGGRDSTTTLAGFTSSGSAGAPGSGASLPPSPITTPASPMSPGAPSAPAMGGGGGAPSTAGGAPSSGTSSPAATNASTAKPSAPSDFQPAKAEAAQPKSAQASAGGGGGGGGGEKAPTEQFAKGLASAQSAAQPTMSPAAATAPVAPVTPPTDHSTAAPIQHAAGSTGGGTAGAGGMPGGGSAGGGSVAAPSSSPPAPPPMPLGPPATPPPAGPPPGTGTAPPAATAGTGPGVNPASTAKADPAAGLAPMPVSAARMERDAAASASTAGAMQRQRRNSSAALIHARHIAAALNMGTPQYGFFWVTGLTADGSIVVANSYGLGYIPDGVQLPPQVTMASADESISPTERAKWVTYPILAIQGWAQTHDQQLRAVIATAEQFASFDPGVAKVVLQRDDIPETGKMQGRDRLEVIAPATASRLASVADGALQDLLPVAPADSTPPEDRSAALWFELTKPLMSTASNRGLTHLEAFVQYADHAQELALHKAHNALDAAMQRTAIADWVYWQHLSVLMSDAISAEAAV